MNSDFDWRKIRNIAGWKLNPLTPSVRYIVRQMRLQIFLFKGKLASELKLFKFACYLSLLLMFNVIWQVSISVICFE